MKKLMVLAFTLILLVGVSGGASAAILNFDDLITGSTSYSFDGDGDGIYDVVFTTTDPFGFNTVGPGSNMSYINEPGLEGTTLLNPDLRVDFLFGALNSLSYGFALNDGENTSTWADFGVYDGGGILIASDFEYGKYTYPNGVNPSSFPEGRIETSFAGVAAYALFDFSNSASGGQRYIIDNFEGKFGSHEIPEPATLLLLGFGLLAAGLVLRKQL
jgi:hypothetical protein